MRQAGREIDRDHPVESVLPNSVASEEKKRKILDIAERLFGGMGFEAVSTRQIAREAGVNTAMISYYFGSKEKLFSELVGRRTNEGRMRLNELLSSEATPWGKMNKIIDHFVNKIFEKRYINTILTREMTLMQRDDVSATICTYYMDTIGEISNVIKEGQKQGFFGKVDVELTIITITSLINYVVNFQVLSRLLFKLPADCDITKNEKVKNRIKKHLKELIGTHLQCKSV